MTLAFWSCSLPRKGSDYNAQLSQLYKFLIFYVLFWIFLFFSIWFFYFLTSTDGFNLIWLDWHSSGLRRRTEIFFQFSHIMSWYCTESGHVLVNIYMLNMYKVCLLVTPPLPGGDWGFHPQSGAYEGPRGQTELSDWSPVTRHTASSQSDTEKLGNWRFLKSAG